jgi:hypothetical protein
VNEIKQLSHEEQIAWQYQCVREDWLEEEQKDPAVNVPERRN